MVRILHELRRHHLHQPVLHRAHILAGRKPRAVGHAEDVRVHRHGRLAEGGVEHHVRGLAAHARQAFQRLARARYFTVVPLEQDPAGGDDVLRLGVEQADGRDVVLQPVFAQREDRRRCVGHREQASRGLVDAHVGGLRGQRHRDQQFERRAIFQFRRRARIEFAQPREQFHHFIALQGGTPAGRGHGFERSAALARARSRMAAAAAGRAGLAGATGSAGMAAMRRASRSAARRSSRAWRCR